MAECIRCGDEMPTEWKKCTCRVCLRITNLRQRERYVHYRENGLCVRCGKKLENELKGRKCESCKDKLRRWKAKRGYGCEEGQKNPEGGNPLGGSAEAEVQANAVLQAGVDGRKLQEGVYGRGCVRGDAVLQDAGREKSNARHTIPSKGILTWRDSNLIWLGDGMRILRRRSGATIKEMARALGMGAQTLLRYEQGYMENARPENVRKVCTHYGKTIAEVTKIGENAWRTREKETAEMYE